MNTKHAEKGKYNENWHIEWKSKHRIFRVGIFKAFTAGWASWKERIPYDTWQRIKWIIFRFVWITKKTKGMEFRFLCFAFGWIYCVA